MTMSSPVGPQSRTPAQPIPVPKLTVLPPSSDTESWSQSSPHSQFHCSRIRIRKRNEREHGCTLRRQWGQNTQVAMDEIVEKSSSLSQSVAHEMDRQEQVQDNLSQDHLLPPSRSWSRSPSPSRRSRWSLRSLLSRDSDWESCRLVSWSRSNKPGSDLNKFLLFRIYLFPLRTQAKVNFVL